MNTEYVADYGAAVQILPCVQGRAWGAYLVFRDRAVRIKAVHISGDREAVRAQLDAYAARRGWQPPTRRQS